MTVSIYCVREKQWTELSDITRLLYVCMCVRVCVRACLPVCVSVCMCVRAFDYVNLSWLTATNS